MKAILQIIETLGGANFTHAKIVNEPYMPLSIERIGEGPNGLPAISVCHYGEQNGDLMRDPEMCFEVAKTYDGKTELYPYYFRNDYAGIEQEVYVTDENGKATQFRPRLKQDLMSFSRTWNRNITAQGFVKAAKATAKAGIAVEV